MIAEIIPAIYDVAGRPVALVSKKRKRLFHGTFPAKRYVSQPLAQQCESIADLRRFLSECRYVSDEQQFNRRDYWMPPEEFKKRKQGDWFWLRFAWHIGRLPFRLSRKFVRERVSATGTSEAQPAREV